MSAIELSVRRGNRIPSWLGIALVATWIAITITAFWVLQWQYLRPFPKETLAVSSQFFEGAALNLPAVHGLQADKSGSVIHFWDPECPCTRFSTPHVRDLIAQADAQGFTSTVIVNRGINSDAGSRLKSARKTFGEQIAIQLWSESLAEQLPIPASPSALVMSKEGRLSYVGPYSSDAFCSTEDGAFVEEAMTQIASGKVEPIAENNLATACFCSWSTTHE